MFINRPLINGRALNKERGVRNSSLVTQTKNKIRIKTLPSSVHHSGNKYGEMNEMGIIEGNLIGMKDIKDMIEGDVEKMIKRLQRMQEEVQSEEKRLKKGLNKILLTKKSTINGQSIIEPKDNKQIELQQQEQKAYKECRQLLEEQRKQEQKFKQKFNQQMSRKFYQLEETRIQLQELRNQTDKQLLEVKGQLNRVENDVRLVSKRTNNRQRLIEEIALENQKIDQMNEKLFTCKQESMRQKNLFVEIQAQEIRLMKDIQVEEGEGLKWNQQWQQFQYYKKIQKLRTKLLKHKAKESSKIEDFFKDKIASIAKVRVASDSLQEKITQTNEKIDEQLAVIQMLNKKNQFQEEQEANSQTAEMKYIHDYGKIFNNAARSPKPDSNQVYSQSEDEFREIEHWQSYKSYLQKILQNQKKFQSLHEPPSHNSSYTYQEDQFDNQYHPLKQNMRNSAKHIHYHFQPQQINIQKNKKKASVPSAITSNQFTPNLTNQKKFNHPTSHPTSNRKPLDYPFVKLPTSSFNKTSNQKQKNSTPLPKLVKMEGNISDKDKIKNQLTKFTNIQLDEQVELETVRTSQCDEQDVIEVEFKGIRSKGK